MQIQTLSVDEVTYADLCDGAFLYDAMLQMWVTPPSSCLFNVILPPVRYTGLSDVIWEKLIIRSQTDT